MDIIGLEKSHSLTQSLWRSEQIRNLERQAATAAGISLFELMERAGQAVFNQARLSWPSARCWWIFTGGGNNAGDGYIVARLAQAADISVQVVQMGDAARLTGDAARARDAYVAKGGVISGLAAVAHQAPEPDLIIDALLGTGLVGPVREEFEQAIQHINRHLAPVVAIDVPSGLCADTGHILTVAVAAEQTVCMVGLKFGLFTGRGPDVVGRLLLADLGVELGLALETPLLEPAALPASILPPAALQETPVASLMHWSDLRQELPQRRRGAHKGEAGRVLVIGGNLGMSGAIRLAGEAALRSGAGLVRLLSHPDHQASLNLTCPELMTASFPNFHDWHWASTLVLGPGLGRDDWAQALFSEALLSMGTDKPLVIDADGLWFLGKGFLPKGLLAKGRLAKHPRLAVASRPWVLTPHSGEAALLLGCTAAEVEADRLAAVRAIQQQYGGVVVLKGAGSLIADECHVRLCHYGNCGMASGGMGDVLSGIIGALMAQGLTPFNAASLAVCLHALAGDMAATQGKLGMLAADLFLPLRSLINQDDKYDDTDPTTGSCR
ncbi:bifunctional ADP-dependent NAD(P)H-hydrate dehydratase/NAD(P)H-hydrate epimerase [Oceanisphaera profunda]|uniref:Bifunctional NAD(P)H-hydrate repair enzyme n=1 Tax=Oceanisphaera profunda TaxID=1416627 RepID=A0A1Y0D6C6_9GAMM|nr:NAD(P)H-hydrate dehydratase [Oceanisphaera profunda]ART83080.1 bifunctional ADP-dependent NAD(P)H-hydrate dehydratase/NAD(P)H-hydrate epimerase [Oceanisphaera profunda]